MYANDAGGRTRRSNAVLRRDGRCRGHIAAMGNTGANATPPGTLGRIQINEPPPRRGRLRAFYIGFCVSFQGGGKLGSLVFKLRFDVFSQ